MKENRSMEQVSLCMVVYNSGELLQKAIKSALPLINEVCIVEQGSNQKDLIKSIIGDMPLVHHITTNKGNADYDRQFCYSMATKPYTLAMDTDEELPVETVEKLPKLVDKYNPEVVWFIFNNNVQSNGITIDLKDMLGDDPHPRFWKTRKDNGMAIVQWPIEAHKFPAIDSMMQVFSQLRFNHNRSLYDILKTHIHRGKNISENAKKVEKGFIKTLLDKFGVEVKKDIQIKVPELQEYLKD